jgi:hypothetical protein
MATSDLSLSDLRALHPDVARSDAGRLVVAAARALAVEPGSADALLLSDATRARQTLGLPDDLPGTAPGAAAALSEAGRALSRLIAMLPSDPGPLAGTSPLQLHPPAGDPGELAQALEATLADSGLFYESHLAAVAAGCVAPAQIEREPQARWIASEAATGGPRAAAVFPHEMLAPVHAPALHGEAQLLVARQLELHATGTFQWCGEAWPGVAMRWAISEDAPPPHRAPVPEPQPRTWTTAFSMALPNLGAVNARLRLCGSELSVAIAAEPGANGWLRHELPELRSRLARAEFTSADCAVSAGAAP